MKAVKTAILATIAFAATVSGAAAQDKPSVSKYLNDGYDVIRVEMSNPFLQFILKKDKTLVWCSVQIQNGETSSCRTIK